MASAILVSGPTGTRIISPLLIVSSYLQNVKRLFRGERAVNKGVSTEFGSLYDPRKAAKAKKAAEVAGVSRRFSTVSAASKPSVSAVIAAL